MLENLNKKRLVSTGFFVGIGISLASLAISAVVWLSLAIVSVFGAAILSILGKGTDV